MFVCMGDMFLEAGLKTMVAEKGLQIADPPGNIHPSWQWDT